MHITFEHLNERNNIDKVASQSATGNVNAFGMNASKAQGKTGVFFSPSKNDNTVYGEKGRSFHDVMDEMSGKDTALYKNYMAVMAGTMSGEDFNRLTKEGIQPGKVDVREAVTIMDHIKAVMAESGVVISGFNGASDLSIEKLTEMTGDAGYANALKNAFAQQDLPLTEDTVKDTIESVDQALSLTEMTDDMKQYLLENDLAPTIDHLYRASFSTAANTQSSMGGYFADSMNGYYGKKPQQVDMDGLAEQIEKIAKEEGLTFDETVKGEAKWMLEKGILLTGRNLSRLDQMNQIGFPLERDTVLSDIAQALREGKQAKDTDLTAEGVFSKAERLYQEAHAITDEAISKVIEDGEILSIRSLSMAQRQIQLADVSGQALLHSGEAVSNVAGDSLIRAKLTLEEVRLKMTVSANISLLKSNYSIDTAQLEDLVEKLKSEEKKQASFGISLTEEKQSLYEETIQKTSQIRTMPVQLIGQVNRLSSDYTLNQVYASGQILKSTFEKAGESYEALMTAPRADLGDRLKSAFRNIDEILADEGFEATEQNQRAVRILAYNQMGITKESIQSVREADEELTSLLDLMTPSATLAMIRDGINPLEQSIPELYQYFTDREDDLTSQTERFGRFLYKLDQNHDITPEERETFVGIYRLIRQIEKGDGKAIGTVVANGQEMNFANLLTAVRTNQTNAIQAQIDDTTMIASASTQNSISDQINTYYKMLATDMLVTISPEGLKAADADIHMSWEGLAESLKQQEMDAASEDAYLKEQLATFRESLAGQTETIEFLVANDVEVTADNLLAAKELMKNRNELYKKIDESLKESDQQQMEEGSELKGSMQELTDNFTSRKEAQAAFEVFADTISDRIEDQMLKADANYLDIKALSLTAKQISLASSMAKQESYELPAMIFGELTSVNVHFVHGKENVTGADAAVTINLSEGKEIVADFKMQGEKIVGFVGCNTKQMEEALKEKTQDFRDQLLLKTQKEADISVIYSETLMQNAGKQVHQTSEEGKEQGRQESSRQLYTAVQVFMKVLQEL